MSEPGSATPLGGYIELQLPKRSEYYPDLIKMNTARSCLEYIIRVNHYSRIYIPYYTCDVILGVVKKLGIEYKFYRLDLQLDPVLDFEVGPSACLLYTNYFGLKEKTMQVLSTKIRNLIVDNAQAFFSHPLPGIDSFYSCRKFFGVPDGAYLQLNSEIRLEMETDVSVSRFSHLIKRIDLSAEDGYGDFIKNNVDLENSDIKKMSSLSQRILESLDYDECRKVRSANFACLQSALSGYNQLSLASETINGPMAYPLLLPKKGIRQKLIANRIFVPTYWPNVFQWVSSDMHESYLAEHLLALPIDHRYDIDDMERIINTLQKLL